jgi:hypothetical protein
MWYDFAVAVNTGSDPSAQRFLGKYNIHASETAWVGTQFDAELDNNGSIDELYQQVKNLALNLPAAT